MEYLRFYYERQKRLEEQEEINSKKEEEKRLKEDIGCNLLKRSEAGKHHIHQRIKCTLHHLQTKVNRRMSDGNHKWHHVVEVSENGGMEILLQITSRWSM
jgi:hypothetical protein